MQSRMVATNNNINDGVNEEEDLWIVIVGAVVITVLPD